LNAGERNPSLLFVRDKLPSAGSIARFFSESAAA
jgi:hypothetical protein